MDDQGLLLYLPTMVFIGLALFFLLLWRLGLASSWQWSAGFVQTGIGFGLSTFPVEPQFDQLASGILFIGAAYCYGSALMIHFGSDRLTALRRGLAAFFLVPHVYYVFVDPNLKLVLFNIEMVFASLFAIAVFMILGRSRNSADRVLVVASALATVDSLVRGIVFTFVYPTSEEMSDFVESAYNLSVHVTTLTICLLFPFSAISALALRAVDRHRQAAARDPMTGLLNRRGFEAAIGELAKSGRTSGSIVIVDIDHFKAINDSLGHDAGDQVIVDMAARLQDRAEQNMVVARFGGEEFVILLRQASEAQAVNWAEMMRQSLKDASVTRLHRASFTASFGVSGMSDLQRDLLPAIRRADQALYHAKRNGRDRVECASGLEAQSLTANCLLVSLA
ncbi:MAG: GGDEF domain-containing protein [Rhizobiaceae bacterium]|nr:GGDEF domain-containing protein [Rhizobiaceae bacterium]MCZ8353038.1 GGDEF domain-containing protein [Rhizobium sp.]